MNDLEKVVSTYLNSNVYKIINSDIENGMVNHAYILHGPDAKLLNAFSKLIAMHFNVQNFSETSVSKPVCKNIANSIFSDVVEFPILKQTKTSRILVDDINNIVKESLVVPLESKHKIFILNEFNLANATAQNKLLKTLEEPSKNVIFLINTTNLNEVLNTIKSRTKKLYVSDSFVETNLQNLRQNELLANEVKQIVRNVFLQMQSSSDVLEWSAQIEKMQEYVEVLFSQIQALLGLATKFHLVGFVDNDLFDEFLVSSVAQSLTVSGINELFLETQTALEKIKTNCNFNMVMDGLLLKILEVKYKCKMQLL